MFPLPLDKNIQKMISVWHKPEGAKRMELGQTIDHCMKTTEAHTGLWQVTRNFTVCIVVQKNRESNVMQ